MSFQKGDILQHKATLKKCVVAKLLDNGKVLVTTQDDESKYYFPHELEKCENQLSAA